MANTNLLLTFSIEKRTKDELIYVREQSAIRRRESRKLETKLEEEKQHHIRTSQELKELKMPHETMKIKYQELPKIIQRQRGE